MREHRRPYIGRIWEQAWDEKATGEQTPGIMLGGAGGISAHLTKDEAYALANRIVDAADKLPESTPAPPRLQPAECPKPPAHMLTDAQGDAEQPLHSTPAD